MPRVLQYLWWPTEALISQEGTISLGEGMVYPHSRVSVRDALMRDKHHLVLDNCTTYTHKNQSKLWLQQTDHYDNRGLQLQPINALMSHRKGINGEDFGESFFS